MASDTFLFIDGIKGESVDDKHKDKIEIESWSFGLQNSGTHHTTGGGGAGKVSMQDLTFTCLAGLQTTILFHACATGKHIPKAQLICRKAGGNQEEFMFVDMFDVLVSSHSVSGGSTGQPMDTFSLNFAKIEYDYKKQDAKGGVGGTNKKGWDFKKHTAS